MAAVARIPFYTRGISHSPAARSSVAPPFCQKLQVQRKFDSVSRTQTTGGIHQVSGLRPMCLSEYRSSVVIRVSGRLGLDLDSEWSRYVSMNLLCHWGMVAMVVSELGLELGRKEALSFLDVNRRQCRASIGFPHWIDHRVCLDVMAKLVSCPAFMYICDSEHISELCFTLYQSDPQVCVGVMEKLASCLAFLSVLAEASKGTGLTLSGHLQINGFLKGVIVDLHEFPSGQPHGDHGIGQPTWVFSYEGSVSTNVELVCRLMQGINIQFQLW